MALTEAEASLLKALITGGTLKSHRYLDGSKLYRIHPLEGEPQPVDRSTVEALKQQRLIDSNMKFPAATYLLTEKGKAAALVLTGSKSLPLTARNEPS